MRGSLLFFFALSIGPSFAQKLDTLFKPDLQIPGWIYEMVPTPGGKILVGGYFRKLHNTKVTSFARLNSDGSFDDTFNMGDGPQAYHNALILPEIFKIKRQSDGKILIAGDFYMYNNVPRARLARLNADGSLDESFVPPQTVFGYNEYASAENEIVLLPDGKILTLQLSMAPGGIDVWARRITRLNSDGSIDETFFSPWIYDGWIGDMALQTDGKILVAGAVTKYNDVAVPYFFRLDEFGGLDDLFQIGVGPDSTVRQITLRPDGKIILTGLFKKFNGVERDQMVQLNSDGTIDNTFSSSGEGVYDVTVESSGTLLLSKETGIVQRLTASGGLDKTYNAEGGVVGDRFFKTLVMPNDKIFVSGFMENGPAKSLIRLNTDLTLDNTYTAGLGPTNPWPVEQIVAQPDGKILLVGFFQFYNGVRKGAMVRLNTDLSIDNTFNTGTGISPYSRQSVVVQDDGKIVMNTESAKFNGTPVTGRMIRLNSDGSIDNSYGAGTRVESTLLKTTNNRILAFANVETGNATEYIVRFNPDGSKDPTFSASLNGRVYRAIALKNGKIVITGGFTAINGELVSLVARLNEDGSLDATFKPALTERANLAYPSVTQNMAEASDGKIVLFGAIPINNGPPQANVIALRLLEDGKIDPTFQLTMAGDRFVCYSGTVLSDDTILLSMYMDNVYKVLRLNYNGTVFPGERPTADKFHFGKFTQTSSGSAFCTVSNNSENMPIMVARITFDPLPGIPQNLKATLSKIVDVDLTWTASTNATNYEVERSSGAGYAKVAETTANSIHIEDLEQQTNYKFRVRAVGANGPGGYSNEASIQTTVGLEPEFSNQVFIYPNPAKEVVYVGGVDGEITVIDLQGRSLGTFAAVAVGTAIDLSGLNTGMYFIKVKSGNQVHVRKIVHN